MLHELIASELHSGDRTEERITTLLNDLSVDEIMINRHDQVFCDRQGRLIPVEGIFPDRFAYEGFISRLLAKYNVVLNESRPIVEFSIGKALRVSLVKQSISRRETVVTIRRKHRRWLDTDRLVESGLCDDAVMAYLKVCVGKRLNCFISGSTSTGKTTLLNALLREVPDSERLVIIEDTPEITPGEGQNAVCLMSREQRYESQEVSISDLVRAALRMRPDRIVLGEVRRDEAVQFIHALNTGHEGSICTGHSRSCRDMVNRLMMLLIESGVPLEAAQSQLSRAIDLMVHLGRDGGVRRIVEITRMASRGGRIRLEEVVRLDPESGDYLWVHDAMGH